MVTIDFNGQAKFTCGDIKDLVKAKGCESAEKMVLTRKGKLCATQA
jgi:hypothetical protein